MKKKKKLIVSRDIVKQLTSPNLRVVVGGVKPDPGINCNSENMHSCQDPTGGGN